MQKCEQLYEGKAKKVFLTENPDEKFVAETDKQLLEGNKQRVNVAAQIHV